MRVHVEWDERYPTISIHTNPTIASEDIYDLPQEVVERFLIAEGEFNDAEEEVEKLVDKIEKQRKKK